jgi:hypothetical protein
MLIRAAKAVWDFLEAWGEMKYEFHKRHNFKAWY